METHLAHQPVHNECRSRHVASIFQDAQEEEEEHDLWQECDHGPDTAQCTGNNQVSQVSGGHQRLNTRSERMNTVANQIHRGLGPGEYRLEDERHQSEEPNEPPNLVRQDAVKCVA